MKQFARNHASIDLFKADMPLSYNHLNTNLACLILPKLNIERGIDLGIGGF